MPKPDRHLTRNYPYRPKPPDLLERLDAVRGDWSRAEVLSDLLARYLDGRPMPPHPWRPTEPGQDGQDSGG